MTNIDYRDATEADAPLMAVLGPRSFVETFGHLYSEENLDAFLLNHSEENWRTELTDPRYSVRLAEQDGEAIGFAKLGPTHLPFEPEAPAAELRQFYVLGPWQGAGIAQVLMDWVIAESRRRGAAEIYLSVFEDNVRAQRFYARHGFEPVGRHNFMVGTQADVDVIMRLTL
jgi:ribosomal protein S18 acetylase RimI-like enzyme